MVDLPDMEVKSSLMPYNSGWLFQQCRFFEPAGYEKMTAEQEKTMQAYLKEQQEVGGKWKKGRAGNMVFAAGAQTALINMGTAMWHG